MRLTTLLPLLIFTALAGVFLVALHVNNAKVLPSTLIGKPVPGFDLPALEGRAHSPADGDGLSAPLLGQGEMTLVNFWASWCAPCRAEHEALARIAKEGTVKIYGINYKDTDEGALRFLRVLGDPFARIGVDADGRVGLDWGVYGVPETYLIDGEGKVVLRHVGPLTDEIWRDEIRPKVQSGEAEPVRREITPEEPGADENS